jgi:hypothetical protein
MEGADFIPQLTVGIARDDVFLQLSVEGGLGVEGDCGFDGSVHVWVVLHIRTPPKSYRNDDQVRDPGETDTADPEEVALLGLTVSTQTPILSWLSRTLA